MQTATQNVGGQPLSARRAAIELFLVVAAVVAFYAVHLDLSKMQTGGDFANLFWPLKEFRLRVLHDAGVLPLWNPYVYMGSPLAATMQHAVFYPVDWLFFWRSPTLPALNFYVLFHLALCGAGAWWWLRGGLRLSAVAACCCGAAYPCTAWFWGAQEHINQLAAVAWMPWMMGMALLFARGCIAGSRFVAVYAALGALQFLAGHPQAAFYTHLAAAAILLLRSADASSPREWFAAKARLLACFAAAGVLTGLLCAVQLLPAMELGDLSYRRFQKNNPSYSLTYSMPPDVFATLVRPHVFGSYVEGYVDQRAYQEYGLFVGVSTLALAAVGAVSLAVSRRRWLGIACIAGVAVTLLLAMGGNASVPRMLHGEFDEFPAPALGGGDVMQDVHSTSADSFRGWTALSLHEIFVAVVPGAGGFRVPARVVVVTALLWLTLAAFGVEALFSLLRRKETARPVVACATCVLGLAMFADLWLPSRGEKFRHPKDVAPLELEMEKDEGLRADASIDDRLYRLVSDDLDLIVSERQRSAEEHWETVLGGNGPSQRWLRWHESDNVVAMLPSVEGYEEGLSPTVRTKDFLFEFNRNLRQFQPDEQLLALLGVGRVLAGLPIDSAMYPAVPEESRTNRSIHRVPAARGAAFWAAQAEGVDFAALDGPFARGGQPRGSRRTDAVPYGTAPRWNERWPKISTDVTDPNEVLLLCDGAIPGDAVLAMAFAPGWTIGGEPVQWLGAVHARVPADAFADGIARLEYKPASFRAGLFLSAVGAMLLAATAAATRRTRPAAP